jgi:hypothetical protein
VLLSLLPPCCWGATAGRLLRCWWATATTNVAPVGGDVGPATTILWCPATCSDLGVDTAHAGALQCSKGPDQYASCRGSPLRASPAAGGNCGPLGCRRETVRTDTTTWHVRSKLTVASVVCDIVHALYARKPAAGRSDSSRSLKVLEMVAAVSLPSCLSIVTAHSTGSARCLSKSGPAAWLPAVLAQQQLARLAGGASQLRHLDGLLVPGRHCTLLRHGHLWAQQQPTPVSQTCLLKVHANATQQWLS